MYCSWWTYQPLEPNTVALTEPLAKEYGLWRPTEVQSWVDNLAAAKAASGAAIDTVVGGRGKGDLALPPQCELQTAGAFA